MPKDMATKLHRRKMDDERAEMEARRRARAASARLFESQQQPYIAEILALTPQLIEALDTEEWPNARHLTTVRRAFGFRKAHVYGIALGDYGYSDAEGDAPATIYLSTDGRYLMRRWRSREFIRLASLNVDQLRGVSRSLRRQLHMPEPRPSHALLADKSFVSSGIHDFDA